MKTLVESIVLDRDDINTDEIIPAKYLLRLQRSFKAISFRRFEN